MKKLLITLIVLAVIAAAGIWGARTFIKPAEIAIAEILPQDVAFYYSIQNIESTWKNIKTSRFWKKFSDLSLWKDIQVASGIEDLQNQFKENIGIALTEENIIKLIGKELVITITPGASAEAPPKILLLCRGKNKQSITEVINPIIAKVTEDDPTRIEKIQYQDNTITHIKPISSDQPEIRFFLLNNILVVGLGDTMSTIEKIADISGGKNEKSLASAETFKKITGLVGNTQKELAGLFYMDFTKMRKYLEALNVPGPEGTPTKVTTGMETLAFMGGWSELKDGLITKLYIYPNTKNLDPELKKMWEAKPQVPSTLKFAPEKTLLYIVSSSIDLSSMWNLWQTNLKAQAPEQSRQILQNIENFKNNWGIDLETEILPLIGNEVAFIFSDINTEGLMPIPKLGLVLKINNKDKADNAIGNIIAKNNEMAAAEAEAVEKEPAASVSEETTAEVVSEEIEPAEEEKPAEVIEPAAPRIRFQINLTDESYEEQTIKAIQLPLVGTGLAPGYTYMDDFLIIGATTKTLQEMIDVTKGKVKPLTYDPMYNKIASLLPKKNNQASYINVERLMEIGIGICNWVISFQQLSMPQGPQPEDPEEAKLFNQRKAQTEATIATIKNNVIPLLDTLKAIKVISTAAVNKEDHIEQTLVLRVEDI